MTQWMIDTLTCDVTESQNGLNGNSTDVTDVTELSNRPILSTVTPTNDDTTTTSPEILRDLRLPSALVPLDYWIHLKPDFENIQSQVSNFDGFVLIKILVTERTDVVTLHSKNLKFVNDSISVLRLGSSSGRRPRRTSDESRPSNFASNEKREYIMNRFEEATWKTYDEPRSIKYYSIDEERNFITMHLEQYLESRETCMLRMNYSGLITENWSGLYKTYYNEGNETK